MITPDKVRAWTEAAKADHWCIEDNSAALAAFAALVRRDALEEAAKACDDLAAKFAAGGDGLPSDPRWAAAIRALVKP